ncbi:mechanosensitive ion channel family protein [Halorubrum sp. AD140]|uniref:mechanosensitive ion channel family protein n=1 Tax=Halorubrum sp. AD140 TaxID=3050073 RepID=UPI002ACC80F9|nr:mechanosensitive ion channel family protein [Halorubrum sp. AD140]MDZ5809844.1 mechanosensitive ion channel family protein [Halorubrum sp. AD140]
MTVADAVLAVGGLLVAPLSVSPLPVAPLTEVVTATGTSADPLGNLYSVLTENVRRTLTSVLILAAVLGVRLLTGWAKRRDEELSSTQRLLLSASVGAATAVGALSLLVVWDRSGALLNAFESAAIADQLSNVVIAVVLLAIAYAVTDFLGGVIREISAESTVLTDHQEEVLLRVTQLTVYTFALLVVVGLFTDNVGGLLVGAGFLGIVVGMAARQTLGAVLAGFVLMFSRPFEVGDWVEVGDHEGTVTEISIMSTRLRSFDGEVVTLPNDDVRSGPIVDRSRRNRLRIEVEVGVDYATDVERAASVIEEAVAGVEDVAAMPEPDVVTKRFDDSAVVLGVRYWIRNPSMRKRWRTQTAAMGAIKTELEAEGIVIPFPQQTLSARAEGTSGPQLDAEVEGRAATRGGTSRGDGGEPADGAGRGSGEGDDGTDDEGENDGEADR